MDFRIPIALYGPFNEVEKNWCKLSKTVFSFGWQKLLESTTFVELGESSAPILLMGPPFVRRIVSFSTVSFMKGLSAAAQSGLQSESLSDPADRAAWYFRIRDLILTAPDEFWCALGLLSSDQTWFPQRSPFSEKTERSTLAAQLLERLLRWWPQFKRFESRFQSAALISWAWPNWCMIPGKLACNLGVDFADASRLLEMSCDEAANLLRQWVDEYRPK